MTDRALRGRLPRGKRRYRCTDTECTRVYVLSPPPVDEFHYCERPHRALLEEITDTDQPT